MAVSGSIFACKSHIYGRSSFFHRIRKGWFSIVAAIETFHDSEYLLRGCFHNFGAEVRQSLNDIKSESNKLNAKDLRISASMIDNPTTMVLDVLKEKGFEVYLVGDCVQDLILKRKPKDFNIATSAELTELVVSVFSRSEIVGQRFPVCHVHLGDTIVKVSSFSTCARKFSRDFGYEFETPKNCDDYAQTMIYLQSDITNNGLLFDPYAKIVYDYLGGVKDIKKQVPTLDDKDEVYHATHILYMMRILGRTRLYAPKGFASFVKKKSRTILKLDKERILMELNHMLAYGSAEASLRLLWRFGLLEKVLPSQATYFFNHGLRKLDLDHNFGNQGEVETNMLLSLLSNLDRLLASDKPCHSILWVAILAFHKALAETPQCPIIVAAFCFVICNGADMLQVKKFLKDTIIHYPHCSNFHELLDPSTSLDIQRLDNGVFNLVTLAKLAWFNMTHKYEMFNVFTAFIEFDSPPPHNETVFGSDALYLKAGKIFDFRKDVDKHKVPELFDQINYELLAMGSMQEVRRTFARVVLATLYNHIYEKECRFHC